MLTWTFLGGHFHVTSLCYTLSPTGETVILRLYLCQQGWGVGVVNSRENSYPQYGIRFLKSHVELPS